jgi:hypothetical protein
MLKIPVPIYEFNVIVFTKQNELTSFGEKYGFEFEKPCSGTTYFLPTISSVVIYLGEKCPGIVSHECLHATNYILSYVGHIGGLEDDEAQAYLLGYLVECIHQKLKIKKRKNYRWFDDTK